MKILAIETSCDETAVAVIRCEGDLESPTFTVLGNALYSQASKHAEFGGVYPNLARREHVKNLIPLLEKALKEAGLFNNSRELLNGDFEKVEHILEREEGLAHELVAVLARIEIPDIDLIAVTRGPGLEPALWAGINFARALSAAWDIPLLPVNHMEGHVASVLAEEKHVEFPALALLVSGGHTELVSIKRWGEYDVIGKTRDDAVGEAFDKVARMLGLPYPGGREISALAEKSRKRAEGNEFSFPRPMKGSDNFDFSFSGLKTAVLYATRDRELSEKERSHVAEAFEDAAVDVLVSKTQRALGRCGTKTLIVAGGVAANTHLRNSLEKLKGSEGIEVLLSSRELSTDNAIMIGMAAYIEYIVGKKEGRQLPEATDDLKAEGKLSL